MTNLTDQTDQWPYSTEAEIGVLAALLHDNSLWDEISDLLTAKDFHLQSHVLMYSLIGKLVDQGRPADHVTLQDELRRQGHPDHAKAVRELPRFAHAGAYRDHAAIVNECAARRKMIKIGKTMIAAATTPQSKPVLTLLNEAEAALSRILDELAQNSQARSARTLCMSLLSRVQDVADHPDQLTGVPTGFRDLNGLTGGLQRGALAVLAGRPSMGKTALALNIAEHIALNERLPVLIFSLDGSATKLMQRLIGSVGRIDQAHLRTGRLNRPGIRGGLLA